MVKFRMYAEYEDGSDITVTKLSYTSDEAEELCMSKILDCCSEHGQCTYYTCVDGYDEELDGYWVEGEWFDDYDEESGTYIKR